VFPDKNGSRFAFLASFLFRSLPQGKNDFFKRRPQPSKRAGLADYYIVGLKKIKRKG